MTNYTSIENRLSYHAVYDDSIAAALHWAATNGFRGVQIPVQVPHFRVLELSQSECDEIEYLQRVRGLHLTLHAHDDNVSLFETDLRLRQGILEYYRKVFAAARRLHALLVTIHLGAPPRFPTAGSTGRKQPEQDLRSWSRAATENLQGLVEISRGEPLICVENFSFTPDVQAVLQPFLDREELALCWDIAKCYDRKLNLDTEQEEFVLRNGEHVMQVHLHDIDVEGRSHRVIGTGVIDFAGHLQKLAEHNVLDFCIEVRPRESARASLEALKQMLAPAASD